MSTQNIIEGAAALIMVGALAGVLIDATETREDLDSE